MARRLRIAVPDGWYHVMSRKELPFSSTPAPVPPAASATVELNHADTVNAFACPVG